jgi:hypothetical protein
MQEQLNKTNELEHDSVILEIYSTLIHDSSVRSSKLQTFASSLSVLAPISTEHSI